MQFLLKGVITCVPAGLLWESVLYSGIFLASIITLWQRACIALYSTTTKTHTNNHSSGAPVKKEKTVRSFVYWWNFPPVQIECEWKKQLQYFKEQIVGL